MEGGPKSEFHWFLNEWIISPSRRYHSSMLVMAGFLNPNSHRVFETANALNFELRASSAFELQLLSNSKVPVLGRVFGAQFCSFLCLSFEISLWKCLHSISKNFRPRLSNALGVNVFGWESSIRKFKAVEEVARNRISFLNRIVQFLYITLIELRELFASFIFRGLHCLNRLARCDRNLWSFVSDLEFLQSFLAIWCGFGCVYC